LAAADPQLLAGADLVVLNPPRAGAAAVVPGILAAGARAVVYLSCNPVSLARDLAALMAPGKLRLRRLQPFDMLPHTPHIEALAVLESA
jgi:tRNA/tmRNA/rRNA uracil-C5-methylase (TrmA/RlmC/RlmD family)